MSVMIVLGACSGEDPTTPDAAEEPADVAMEYALEKSGGETEGCSTAKPGPESEEDPGCIFSAAFAGCQDGLEGSEDAIAKAAGIRDEFPKAPKLWEVYDQAVVDCS